MHTLSDEDLKYYLTVRERLDISLTLKFDLPYYFSSYIGKWIKIERFLFYNRVRLMFDMASLPQVCREIDDLSCRYVLYGIWCNGKLYIGMTTDFGERMMTHIMDSKKSGLSQELYSDMSKTGEAFCFIIGIFETEEQLSKAEDEAIAIAKKMSVLRSVDYAENKLNVIMTMGEEKRERERRYCYNIAD